MRYYIWSHRKDQWWGPDHGGYSNSLAAAGEYSSAEAANIMLSALPGANVAVETKLAESKFAVAGTVEVAKVLEVWRRL